MKAIIFDMDGVLVDSETISAKIFMEMAELLGFKMDFDVIGKVFINKIKADGKSIAGKITQDQYDVVLKLKRPVSISSGQKIKILLDLK